MNVRIAMTAVVWLGVTAIEAVGAEPALRPNVVILFADDLGYGELGCQGNPQIPTPAIDSIAAGDVRFTAGYVTAAYCSPSRAGILAGRHRVGSRLVLSAVEHSALLHAAEVHEAAGGSTEFVPVDGMGRVSPDVFAAALQVPGTALAALQSANHGVVSNVFSSMYPE